MAASETPVAPVAPDRPRALVQVESILVRDEVVEAWAIQRRVFALNHRRLLLAATNNRLMP